MPRFCFLYQSPSAVLIGWDLSHSNAELSKMPKLVFFLCFSAFARAGMLSTTLLRTNVLRNDEILNTF